MRSFFSLILLLAMADASWAGPTVVKCPACRDVYQYPADYGNHGFNQVFSNEATLSLSEGDRMQVISPTGQWAMVDLDFVFYDTGFMVGTEIVSYSISLPTDRIQISVQDPRGNMTEYQVISGTPPLEVGGGSASSTSTVEPEPEPEPEPVTNTTTNTNKAGTGEEIMDWGHEGAYYWYQEQPQFRVNIGGEM